MTNYPTTLITLMPGAKFSYRGAEVAYKDIFWSDSRTQPTKEECDAAWPGIKYEIDVKAVERGRKARYEKETDPIFFKAQRSDGDLTAWIAAVAAVKAELPYPSPVSE